MPNKTSLSSKLTSSQPDNASLQAVVNRRLALRLGLSMPVAAVVAQLAGLGPREAR